MNPETNFRTLRPELFAATRKNESELKGLMGLGKLVGEQFSLQLSEWSGAPMVLPVMAAENKLQDLLDGLSTDGVCGIAENSDGTEKSLIAMNYRALEQLIHQFFGGGPDRPEAQPTRDVGKIGRSLATAILEALTHAVEHVFAAAEIGQIHFAGLADEIHTLDSGDLANPVRLNISEAAEAGAFYVALPRSAVERFSVTQSAMEQAAKAAPDSIWQARMQEQVKAAEITIEAVLDGPALSLAHIIGLQAGQLISLGTGLDAVVHIEHRGVPIFAARLGQTDGALSLCIESPISSGAHVPQILARSANNGTPANRTNHD